MRGMNARFLLVITLVLGMVTLAWPLMGQSAFPPWTIWSTYHHDSGRTGQNINSIDTKDPSTIKAVWAFPRTDAGGNAPGQEKLIVDDSDANFTALGKWQIASQVDTAFNTNYHYTDAIPHNSTAANISNATWLFPSGIPPGKYQIFVWVPSGLNFATTAAVYSVLDDFGSRSFTLNQSSATGTWQLLSNNFFTFTGRRPNEGVQLTARVGANGLSGTQVIADAVKFVQATAQEIYSSPASANIHVTLTDPDDPATVIFDDYGTCVYTGTIEPTSLGASGVDNRDKGAIYCIYGITPTTVNPARADGTPNPAVPDSDRLVKISKYLGKPKWRYPRNGTDPTKPDYVNNRLPIEGPISGGVYSSPTLALITQPNGAPNKLVCFTAGMDRQLYALDAETGDLLWKGPGFTVGEEYDPAVVGATSGWFKTDTREDAFGGQFHYAVCDSPDPTKAGVSCTWLFTGTEQTDAAPSGAEGLSYAIYAWMPDAGGTGTLRRSPTATYTINYTLADGTSAQADVAVDQREIVRRIVAIPNTDPMKTTCELSPGPNVGTWVKLGLSYFNPTSVVLKNTAIPEKKCDPDDLNEKQMAVSDYCVVADALMFVPDTINGMGYSTPITDAQTPPSGGDAVASNVYQVTETGRVLSFMVHPFGLGGRPSIGHLNWVYPAVRTKKSPKPSEMDQPSLGSIGASPAFSAFKLYVAGMDGTLRCLNAVTGEQTWSFSTGGSATTGEGGGGFTSSPALDGTNVYIGSTGGHMYALKMDTGTKAWEYPSDANNPPDNPLGAFRYSTPAVATPRDGIKRVWCASADGHIYSFRAVDGARLFIDDGGNPQNSPPIYEEPSFGNPVQGSVALDGPGAGGEHIMMYVGDMGDRAGTLHWRDAETGEVPNYYANSGEIDPTTNQPYDIYEGWTAPDILFSSPNITNLTVDTTKVTWIYIGCADGHLIAFSRKGGGWGGEWQGGDWPFPGNSRDQNAQRTSAAPDTQVQFDVFSEKFFNDSLGLDPDPDPTLFAPSAWPANVIVSKEMKLPSKTDPTLIDQYLTDQAKLRRNQNYLAASRIGSASSTGVVSDTTFYEWGEHIYCIVWNLPEQKYLYGTGAAGKVRPRMTNQSCGESAGATSSGQSGNVDGLDMHVRSLRDYTVLMATVNNGTTTYGPLPDANGYPVRRSYALISIDIDGSIGRQRPPPPGPGWTLYVDLDKIPSITSSGSVVTNAPAVHESIPLAKLKAGKSGGYDIVTIDRIVRGKTIQGQAREAALGINNPLGIRDDGIKDTAGSGNVTIGWNVPAPNRYDPDVHLNGNLRYSASTNNNGQYNFSRLPNPLIYLGQVVHGTSSREAPLGIMDRSAMGISARQIGRFRVEARDLAFRGGVAAIESQAMNADGTQIAGVHWGFKFPWDMDIGSIDYPNIYTRYESFQLVSTDLDPSLKPSSLLAVQPTSRPATFETSIAQPDTMLVSVDVPRFQPANESADSPGYTGGYGRSMVAYVDSNNDGNFDSGNISHGRPTSWQETYRSFSVGLKVPPDPKIQVDEQLIDIGRAPHGLGQNMLNDYLFTAYNKNPLIQQWFKPITIKNAGNVNLYNMRIDQALALFGDQSSPSQVLPGMAITSSLNVTPPPGGFSAFAAMPFMYGTAPDAAGTDTFLGYTLSKPRVGDADPTVMTIPDRRRWDVDPSTHDAAAAALAAFKWTDDPKNAEPLPVFVSVQVPLTQPVGTYQSWDPSRNAPYIPVFSNLSSNVQAIAPSAGDPVAMPSFQLKLAVRESQLTGGVTPTTLPQIDFIVDGNGNGIAPTELLARWGDATPAAFRDANPKSLRIHLFYSSNRMPTPPAPGDPNFASAPWFIHQALLDYNSGSWVPAVNGVHWWGVPGAPMPASQWDIPSGGTPPSGLMVFSGSGASALYSVKHFSPSIAENLARSATSTANRTWLVWAGTADFRDPATNKISQQNLIFYTDITQDPDPKNTTTTPAVYAIEHDPSMAKRYPSALVDGNDMWMFWQGGNAGSWSIYYSLCNGGPTFDTTTSTWQPDMKLRTPDSMAAVGSPNPILRHLWADLRGSTGSGSTDFTDPFTAEYRSATKLLDVVYAGTNKITRNADIMLSRYALQSNATDRQSPSRTAQRLPRIYNEKLARDPKLGFYTSHHIAWVRLTSGQPGVADAWGTYVPSNLPYVHVVFSSPYVVDSSTTLPAGTIISATDGITPDIDSASGVYTYSYPAGTPADLVLGKMIVDFSAGIIRFQKPFKETATTVNGVTKFSAPEVYADYTPQAWRITTDSAVDGSPRAFIERTSMTDPNDSPIGKRVTPGLEPQSSWPSSKPAPVDRLWVFWRKTGASIENSTIFYTTMRVGIDLTKLGLPPITVDPLTGTLNNPTLSITGALGPWEVDRTGTKVYFSEVDERYQSMAFPGAPGPIGINYTVCLDPTGNNQTQISRQVADVSWITELPEQSLGPMMDANVNEGSIYAFADPQPQQSGTSVSVRSSKIWVFWTSTRGGSSDLFWETLSPNFWGR